MTSDTARSLWLSHEAATHSLSQQLTEHLRLILAPTLATKLRGDFRTGKRLNLKRIIPYIASGYKRDKIWLRRSQPSKRSYQSHDCTGRFEIHGRERSIEPGTQDTNARHKVALHARSRRSQRCRLRRPDQRRARLRQALHERGWCARCSSSLASTPPRPMSEGWSRESLELFGEARRKGASSAGRQSLATHAHRERRHLRLPRRDPAPGPQRPRKNAS